ncbi:MAG TPA: amidohydrolase family protein, partial [Petrotogaceae bacterium]|nr:amidohydrolase family protein [Petrotogaceae bacterium]
MKLRDMIPVALGEKNADCILKNAKILNVFTGETEVSDIALFDKRIAGVGSYDNSDNITDLDGLYVIPGFIDAHVHIESTMLSPLNFAKLVILNGTTTVIADPHEIVNVMGVDGLEYINNSTEGIALNVYIAIPSCVPATSLETSGAKLGPDDMIGFIDSHLKRTVGLGEVMNYPGVLSLEPELITKIEILRHRYKKIDGHAPGLSGKKLNGYINAFIRSDHECTTKEEAIEKLSKGMHI